MKEELTHGSNSSIYIYINVNVSVSNIIAIMMCQQSVIFRMPFFFVLAFEFKKTGILKTKPSTETHDTAKSIQKNSVIYVIFIT